MWLALSRSASSKHRRFLSATRKLTSEAERQLIPGKGGVRKSRSGLVGRGERGGARANSVYHDAGMPLFALTAYAKNEQADLRQQDRNAFRELTTLLARAFKRGTP